jgi:NAD(P)-dependent dehydrogenase (short-subunit alcohol dehydrogenase family)
VHGRDVARGGAVVGPTANLDVATFDRLLAANIPAPYFLVAALAPKMASPVHLAEGGHRLLHCSAW